MVKTLKGQMTVPEPWSEAVKMSSVVTLYTEDYGFFSFHDTVFPAFFNFPIA